MFPSFGLQSLHSHREYPSLHCSPLFQTPPPLSPHHHKTPPPLSSPSQIHHPLSLSLSTRPGPPEEEEEEGQEGFHSHVFIEVRFLTNPMDPGMKQLQECLTEIEIEAEHLLLATYQLVENDKVRNGNREALTALRKKARTTRSSVPSAFETIMREVEGTEARTMLKEVCATYGNYDSKDRTWMMFPGSDIFACVPFHAAHTILEKDQEHFDFEAKKLQSYVKEKSFLISERGALADKINPSVLKSLVTFDRQVKVNSGLPTSPVSVTFFWINVCLWGSIFIFVLDFFRLFFGSCDMIRT